MKKTMMVCSVVMTAFFITLSCEGNVEDVSPTTAVTAHMTPIAEVKQNIQHYVDSCYTLMNDSIEVQGVANPGDSIIRAYTISDTDLLSVLGLPLSELENCLYKECRVYIGLDPAGKFKLYLTPMVNGKDTILQDRVIGEYLLDLNAPCPSTCGGTDARLRPAPRTKK